MYFFKDVNQLQPNLGCGFKRKFVAKLLMNIPERITQPVHYEEVVLFIFFVIDLFNIDVFIQVSILLISLANHSVNNKYIFEIHQLGNFLFIFVNLKFSKEFVSPPIKTAGSYQLWETLVLTLCGRG